MIIGELVRDLKNKKGVVLKAEISDEAPVMLKAIESLLSEGKWSPDKRMVPSFWNDLRHKIYDANDAKVVARALLATLRLDRAI